MGWSRAPVAHDKKIPHTPIIGGGQKTQLDGETHLRAVARSPSRAQTAQDTCATGLRRWAASCSAVTLQTGFVRPLTGSLLTCARPVRARAARGRTDRVCRSRPPIPHQPPVSPPAPDHVCTSRPISCSAMSSVVRPASANVTIRVTDAESSRKLPVHAARCDVASAIGTVTAQATIQP